ncbi:hypothetical protein AN2340V1_5126 (plasmid) [Klebsiella variicola]|nr:hypothetical protein AN2340V1_5126 [Klebsiella variicola]CAH6268018.1 hypothetical protein AN2340V1_5126 [Klebsiella variicola]
MKVNIKDAPPRSETIIRNIIYAVRATAIMTEYYLRSFPVVFLSLYTILCKCLFSEVTVEAVTELDDKTAHCHAPVPQRHRPFL